MFFKWLQLAANIFFGTLTKLQSIFQATSCCCCFDHFCILNFYSVTGNHVPLGRYIDGLQVMQKPDSVCVCRWVDGCACVCVWGRGGVGSLLRRAPLGSLSRQKGKRCERIHTQCSPLAPFRQLCVRGLEENGIFQVAAVEE